ncbi:MAG: PKD domain-containing protein [Melioribacteraceae bacterium]|nr:PKD domain-containing protein [Melioribacteraceae bacterium]
MKIKFWQLLNIGIMFIGISAISAQQSVNFVTYGAEGNPKEGDNDFKQIFFIKVDENAEDSFGVELFDIDCAGENDQAFNQNYNSEFRFSIFGGKRVFTSKSITLESPRSTDLYKGKLIKEIFVRDESEYDDRWIPFVNLNKSQGEFVDGAYYFKLLVEGVSGDDANVFNVRIVSENNDKIKIINYAPTVRILPRMAPIQLRFNSGENLKLMVKNYDADRLSVSVQTPYRSDLKLKSSGDGNWKSDLVELKIFEKNEICAIQFGPGGKRVNDAIFSIKDELGDPIPISLPILTEVPNYRPVIRKEIIRTEDCNLIIFDASKSYDISKEKISVKWIFPNGVVKDGFREEVRFQTAGKYPIILAIKDNSNSVESGIYEEFDIIINEIPTAIAGDDIHRVPNKKVYFNGSLSYDHDGKIKTYEWDFGDGSSGNGKKTSHIYSEPGIYNVKLKVTDNYDGICNSNVDSFYVMINAAPIANAGEDIHCSIGEIVNFDGSKSYDPDGHLISYQWNFDDDEKGLGKNVSHSFQKGGKYNITLKVTDNSLAENKTSIDNMVVWVNNPPIAKAGNDVEIAVGEVLTLDASNSKDTDGEIAEYLWSSSNQFEKSDKIFSHTFLTPGKYEVKLKIKDNSGTKSEYAEDIFTVTVNAPPIANAGTNRYQTNADVLFDASNSSDSDGEITKYHWDFGDGSSSNLQSVKHYYKNNGEYNVTLTVQDNSPALNNSTTTEVKVIINAKPIADAGPNKVVAPSEVFNISAKNSMDIDGDIVSTDWFLDNKIISSESDFSFSFDESGSYNIQLRVADNSNHPEAIDYDNLTVVVNKSPTIIINDYYKIAVGETINFDASKSFDSDGKITNYEWRIDNNVISNKAKLTYKFDNAGTHYITLFVTDNSDVNNSISEKSIVVYVNSSPTVNYISDINSCNNLVTLSATEVFDQDGDILAFTWDLGDGTFAVGREITHLYNTAGSYPILLTVDDGHNLSNSKTTAYAKVKINSAPIANAGVDEIICTGDIVTLDGSKSYDADGDLLKYEWDFGDSTFASGITVNKIYNTPGLYSVKLKVSDNSGLECNYSYDTKVLKVVESPVAFAGEDIIACSGKEVFFDAYKSTDSDGIVNSFIWDFGDGSKGSGEKTSHVYKETGLYTVILTITGEQAGECDNVDTDELIVTVKEAPLAEFSYQDSIAVNNIIKFDASLSDGRGNEITNYYWNFGDGTIADSVLVEHSFENAGIYIVELKVNTDNKSNCNSTTIKKTVYVNDSPIAIAESNLFADINNVLTFDATKSYDPNGKITQYNWNFGDGTTEEGINVFHKFNKSGKYKVVLTVKDNTNLKNNSATHKLLVEVNSLPTGEIELPEYGFVGNRIVISGKGINDIDGKIESIVWSIGEFVDSTSINLEHIFQSSGKYDVICEITDDKNATTQLTKSIMIYEIPRLTITAPKTVCLDEKINLKASYTIDNSDILIPIEWHMPNGRIISGEEITTTFSKSGIQKIEVLLTHPKNKSEILIKKEFEILVNQAPIAKISDIKETFIGGANDNILFDASDSYDPDGNKLTYKWDMDDGNKYDGVKIFHTYLKSGTYKVTLTVSDNKDCGSSKSIISKTIIVTNRK